MRGYKVEDTVPFETLVRFTFEWMVRVGVKVSNGTVTPDNKSAVVSYPALTLQIAIPGVRSGSRGKVGSNR